MKPLNLVRSLRKQLIARASVPNLSEAERSNCVHLLGLCAGSQKFMLPDGGFQLPDIELRALNTEKTLRLPYQLVALEFRTFRADKLWMSQILLLNEQPDEGLILISSVIRNPTDGFWIQAPVTLLPTTMFFGTGLVGECATDGLRFISGVRRERSDVLATYETEIVSLVLNFLNALACSNVHTDQLPIERARKKAKDALPFDTYHVLTVDSVSHCAGGPSVFGAAHRAPREHLRRGHIRTLGDGRCIWVNATVVNAGRGFGRVTKDYALRRAA